MFKRALRNRIFSPSQAVIILVLLFIYSVVFLFTQKQGGVIPNKGPGRSVSAVPFLPENPINLNTADFYDLQLLPFIGRGYATQILEYRKRQGGFKNVHELRNIPGIHEDKFKKLRAYVIVP